MKITKTVFLTLLLALFVSKAYALDPDECGNARGKFTNLSFVYNHLDQEGYPKLHSDKGFAFTKGNTYYLHRPIAGCLRFGIDAAWMDLSYDNFKVEERLIGTQETVNSFDIHHIDMGMQVGLSATVNLFKRFQANVYFRYNPSLVLMYNNDELQGGFANLYNTGVCATYGRVGLGIEARFGSSKMNSYFANEYDDYDDVNDWTDIIGSRKLTTKFSGLRAYISFRI